MEDTKYDSIFDALSLGYIEYQHKHVEPIMLDQRASYALDDLMDSIQAFCVMKNQATCDEIAKSLDKLYPGTHCKGVIYTINTDNPFFGMVVMPVFDASREKDNIEKNSAKLQDQNLKPYFVKWYQDTMDVSKEYQKDILKRD